jgi:uncharacterized protein (DUF1015 family)
VPLSTSLPRVLPFSGWRYAPGIDLDSVAAPPYDVIDAAGRAALAGRDEHNVVHLTLPQPDPAAGRTAYQIAADIAAAWRAQGILRPDPAPALYLLRQQFHLPDGRAAERRGFIGQLRLAAWGQGILPHERTFPQAKADRLALLKATGLHDSPIFTVFQDRGGEVGRILTAAQKQPPAAAYRDDHGDVHELWRGDDPDLIAHLTALMQERTLYVADGHHRYETALAYQVWRQQEGGGEAAGRGADYCLAYFAAMEDPGLVILPTHRLVMCKGRVEAEPLLAALEADFDLLSLADEAELIAELERHLAGAAVFGLVLQNLPPYLLRLRPHPAQQRVLLADHPAPVAALPVAILQSLVLGPYFGVSADPQTQKAQLQFEPDAASAAAHVRAGRAAAALLTRPTSLIQLRRLADAGCVAPPKATYFYPKLPSGLVFSLAPA